MRMLLRKFSADEAGATAIEYGLIAAGIAVAIISAVQITGNNLGNVFTKVADGVAGTKPPAAP